MTAQEYISILGKSALGRCIYTEAMGDWTGGLCEIVALRPDLAAPEIVFQVKRLADGEEIGVFGYEEVISLRKDECKKP